MAKITTGEKVFIITTGELGILRSYLDSFTALVDVDGEVRSVHVTAFVKASDFGLRESEKEKPKVLAPDKFPVPAGLWFVLQPMRNMRGDIERFQIWLCNRLDENLLVGYSFYLQQTLQEKLKKEIPAGSDVKLHFFKSDNLNDLPLSVFDCWVKNAEGTSNHFKKELRIKAKNFFNQIESETFAQKDFLTFEIVKTIPDRKEKIKMVVTDTDDFWEPHVIKKEDHQIWEKATMPDFIDLHIEALEKEYKLLDKGEILHIQMKHFERFLDKAIKHGVHRIYAVHGLGKGKLKSEIEKILDATPEVISYNNDHNVRFGYGATEIYL